MKITFLGAAETVTGSSYLVEVGDTKFLIDHGMFQGSAELEHRNGEVYPFNPSELDFMILTHAHIDHSGLIPKLVKHGFKGRIYMTLPTRELTEILLLDSAKIQETNLRLLESIDSTDDRLLRNVPEFLYSTQDALDAVNLMQSVGYEELFKANDEVSFKLVNAGHILGAASIQLFINEGGKEKIVAFSGDLGHDGQDVVKDKSFIDRAEYVVMESLYGGKLHEARQSAIQRLINIITDTTKRGGNVIIPIFAVQRTQELLFDLREMKQKKQINSDIDVYLDSPLAQKATEIYKRDYKFLKGDFNSMVEKNMNPMDFYRLHITNNKQSKKINRTKGAVIMAGSGMCNGGRVVGHLMNNLGDKRNSVAFVGFQADDTLGRKILERQPQVVIYDKIIDVKAEIYDLLGFSAHADKQDLMNWVNAFDRSLLKKIFLVHAELDQSLAFKDTLNNNKIDAQIPKWKETITI